MTEEYGEWWDGNYLTQFVSDYFSDGYINGWNEDEYNAPEHLIPIEESEVCQSLGGEEIYFGYCKGWTDYVDFMQFAGYALMVWLVIALTPLFAGERETRMDALIFTAENGRSKDVGAKLAAAFTVTIVSFLAVAGIAFCVIASVYGLGGAKMLWGFYYHGSFWKPLAKATMAHFTALYLVTDGLALLMTCGFCVLVSAEAKSSFASLAGTGCILMLPVVYRLLGGAYILCAFQPIFLVLANGLVDATIVLPCWVLVFVGVFLATVCTLAGQAKWKRIAADGVL